MLHYRYCIGMRVMVMDKFRPHDPPIHGKIVGTDPSPPLKTKREGPCYIIRPDHDSCPKDKTTSDDWLFREENEILEEEHEDQSQVEGKANPWT